MATSCQLRRRALSSRLRPDAHPGSRSGTVSAPVAQFGALLCRRSAPGLDPARNDGYGLAAALSLGRWGGPPARRAPRGGTGGAYSTP